MLFVGRPRVTLTPFYSLVRNINERLDIACSVESVYPRPRVSWFKNNNRVQRQRSIALDGQIRSYFRIDDTNDDMQLNHYTCSAENGVQDGTNATVSVVIRGR